MAILDLFRKKPIVSVAPTAPYRAPRTYRQAFEASALTRFTQSWYVQLRSPNKEMQYDVQRLRGLSRYLARNDVYTARYLELLQIHVVGSQGIQLTPRITGPNGDLNTVINQTILGNWIEWKDNYASLEGQMTFQDMEQMIIRTAAQDGEIFIRLITSPRVNKYGFSLMMMDADLLDSNYNMSLNNNMQIVQGVEVNQYGVPQAYHFWSNHPDDAGFRPISRIRVPAAEILHLYRPLRPGQLRGLPWTAPSMYFLARLHEYMDAELVASQAGASQVATIETPATDGSSYLNTGNTDSGEVIDLQSGVMLRLAPGEKMNAWDSRHPNTAFDAFVKSLLHGIASSLNVSYSSLASDTSEENYASGRLGVLLEREYFKNLQTWLIRNLHDKIYPIWLLSAIDNEAFNLPDPNYSEQYKNVIFRGRSWAWADPKKEMDAYAQSVEMNIVSKTQICSQLGKDFTDVLNERYEEIKLERQYEKDLVEAGLPPIEKQSTVLPDNNTVDGTINNAQ